MSKPLTAEELENIPGSPAWSIKHHGLFEAKIGENTVIITKGLGRYLVHDDRGDQIGSGETPGSAMLSASVFGGVLVSLNDEGEQDEAEEES